MVLPQWVTGSGRPRIIEILSMLQQLSTVGFLHLKHPCSGSFGPNHERIIYKCSEGIFPSLPKSYCGCCCWWQFGGRAMAVRWPYGGRTVAVRWPSIFNTLLFKGGATMPREIIHVIKIAFLACATCIKYRWPPYGHRTAIVRPPYGHRTAIVIFETSRQLLYSLSLLSAAAGLTFAWGPELNRSKECAHSVFQWLPDKYE